MKVRSSIALVMSIGAVTLSTSNVHAETHALETIVVIGTQREAIVADLYGSVDVLTQEELSYERVDDTLELFNKAPGVYLSRYNQGIINTDIAIRGFAGDGVTPHAKLLIDGIPANLHNGYNELDQLFPLSISSIAVFKGTSDPRYGLYNIAGNYNVTTRQDDAKHVELTVGSFNTQEVQGYAGFSNEGFIQSYAVGYRTSEGYRDHTDLNKYSLAGSWQWNLENSKEFRIIARSAGYEGDSPGYFNDPQTARANPSGSESFANQDGGDKKTHHLSTHWSQNFNEDMLWELKGYAQSFERERWVRFSDGGSLQNRYDDQEQWGLTSKLSWQLEDNWSLAWGADYEYQDVLEQRFRTVSNDSRVRDESPAGVIRDRAYDFTNYGTYLQLFHEPTENLRWNLALRADRLDGDYQNQASGETREVFDFGTIFQPKFNIVYAPSEFLNVFANFGRSFQHPFGSAAYQSATDAPRDVSINDGWEIGTQWLPSDALTMRLSYWQQNASDEFINVDGTNRNIGETERSGFDVAFTGTLSKDWSYWGNFTVIESEIVKAGDALTDSEGNELRSIPDYTASLGINYQVTQKFIARVHWDSQGDYYINEANVGGKFGDYSLLSASAEYDAGWGLIKLQLNNITDEYYEYAFDFGNDSAFTIHSPGDGINGSLSVSLEF